MLGQRGDGDAEPTRPAAPGPAAVDPFDDGFRLRRHELNLASWGL
jgi:hypothetical protein